MKNGFRDSIFSYFVCAAAAGLLPAAGFAADAPIVHQITLPGQQTWCSDSMIDGLLTEINSFRVKNGRTALTVSSLGMQDAELRASQFATYMRTHDPTAPGFNPHEGYDTTAASLGYNLVSENLAYITTDPVYIVEGLWQDSLHLAALLASDATVMGGSCVYDGGTAFWSYEPGACTGTACGSTPPPPTTPPPTTPPPTGTPTLDSEDWAFLTLINNYRAQNGVGPLQVSVALSNAALWMSTDMANLNYFSHTDSQGRSTGARLAAFGYTYSPWGENLAAGYADAQSTFDQWRTACDPDASGNCTYAHQKNMLGAGYTAIGIARAYGGASNYGWYWTTDFGGVVDQSIPTVPPAGGTPQIASFIASPASVTSGQSASLSWSVAGATSITLDSGIGTVTGTSVTVRPNQTTTYTLTALNSSGSSASRATVTVAPAGDTQPPSAPVLTSAVASSSNRVDLAWTASTDNVGVTGYQVLRNGAGLATISGASTTYSDTSVNPGTTYSYAIRALDAAGNQSPLSAALQVTTPTPPVTGSTCLAASSGAFTGCYYNNITLTGTPSLVRTDPQINFDWGGNQPDRAVARGPFSVRWQGNFTFDQGTYNFSAVTSDGMRIYIDGARVLDRWFDQVPTVYTLQQTLSQGIHLVAVEYYDSTGSSSAHLTWQSGAPVVQRPAILAFSASPASVAPGQSSTLTWSVNAATTITIDSGVGDITGATSRAVSPAQTTSYTLTATNSAGSSTAKVTVSVGSVQDTQAPTAPVLTAAAASGSNQVNLAWLASVDNVGVAGYQVLRNGSAITSVAGTSLTYTDNGVTAGASYSYSVQAFDAAGNYSPASNSIPVTVPTGSPARGSCPAPGVNAFTGCYYTNLTLSGVPTLVRTDPQINFDWLGNPPDRSLGRSGFSARWQGNFDFAQGVYIFTSVTSDGMRVYIDGTLVLDKWMNQTATQYTVQQTLSQGQHLVTVEYYESTGWSTAHLTWQTTK